MKTSLSLLSLSIALATQAAAADDTDIERILVTSDFRQQDLQTLPASVSVIPDVVIQDRQAQHLDEVLNTVANVTVASGAGRGRFFQIRGIGERSQFAEPINPSVGVVVDDFDFSGIAAVGTLFDVQQVEVLRGPQATEFGAGAMAGVIKIKTVDATAEQENRIVAGLASKNSWRLGAAFGSAITDKLFYRVAAEQYKSDGFIENAAINRDDTDNLDEFTGRIKVKYLATDDTTLDFQYQYFDIDNGYDAFSLDNVRTTLSDEPGFDTQETHAVGVKLTSQFETGTLVAIANYSTSELGYGYDEDWTFVGFHPFEYSSTDHYFRDRDTTSVDVRFLSNENSALFNGTTDWVIGAYTRIIDEELLRQYTFNAADFTGEYEPTMRAVYANADTRLSDSLTLRVGLRVDEFDFDYSDSSGFVGDTSDTMVGGKVALDYAVGNTIVYTSVSRGYKAGGTNPDERVTPQNRFFEPEFNWNYEIGVKGNINDDAFVRVAAFYMDREDTQVSDFDVQLREDGTPDFIDVIGNADTGTNLGLEVEASWQVNDRVLLSASYGYLDATFSGYTLADGTQVAKQEQAQSPKHSFSFIADVYLTDTLRWQLNGEGRDDHRFSDGHDVRSKAYFVFNSNLNWQLDDWTLSVWGKNLLDTEYYTRGFGGFSNDPRDEYAFPEPYFQLADGRQYGVTAQYHF